jgi:hypothetical protein
MYIFIAHGLSVREVEYVVKQALLVTLHGQ